jgi:hypothetical protein
VPAAAAGACRVTARQQQQQRCVLAVEGDVNSADVQTVFSTIAGKA